MPRPTNKSSVAGLPLFPLLAAFLCAAGALATLVHGYEVRGRQLAMQAAQAMVAHTESSDLVAERDGINWRIEQLQKSRDATQEQLVDKQRELSHVEDHLRRLNDQAERVRLAVDELERQGDAESASAADATAELERLRRAIAAAERELLEQERTKRDRPVTYSVVPYTGPNQTKRRPIYIECRKDSVIIQSEGVVLGETDFEGSLGPGNPLAASIRAYSEHLAGAGFTGETTRPYPMLLVRPDGIEAYYAARAALQSWGTEFGYELVGSDWKLDFPPPDGPLSSKLQQVIADARRRQEALAQAAPRQFKRPRATLRASTNGRGFVSEGDSEGGRYGGSRYAGGRGRSTGFGSGENGTGNSSNRSAIGGGSGGRGVYPSQGTQPGGGSDALANGEQLGGGASDHFGNDGGGLDGGGDRFGGEASRNSGQAGGYGSEPFASPGGQTPFDGQATAGGQSPPGGQSPLSGQAAGGRQQGMAAPPNRGLGDGSATQQSGSQASAGTGQFSEGSLSGATGTGSDQGPQLGNPGGQPGAKSGASRSPFAGQPGGGGENKLGPLGSPGQGFQSDAKQPEGSGSGNTRVGSQPGDSNNSNNVGSAGGSPSTPNDSQSTPSVTMQAPQDRREKSIASKRGQDWGLPDAGSHMTPVTRPVIVRCEPNQLTIVPDDNRTLPKTIPFGPRTDDSVDQLVSGVWDHMKGWGLAGRGLYWRPTLSMEVAPGAERRFGELQALLQDSGIEVKQRQIRR